MKGFISLISALFLFGSCLETPEFDNAKEATYTYNFEKKYGEIAPDQDWGFGDGLAGTRTVIKENHEWQAWGAVMPKDVTENERKEVEEWFNTHPNPVTLDIDWMEFWILPISKSDHAGHMNQVTVGEEINDINGGYGWKRLVTDGNTKTFRYGNSETGQVISDKYVIQKIGSHYYLGFYYYGTKWDNGDKTFGDKDGLYNDWIFRLEPAKFKYQDSGRIIAEDLGNTGDFDFNDVVFDYHWLGFDKGYVITLLAVGGTLPLYIDNVEVHGAFGVDVNTFVNTSVLEMPPVMFRVNSREIKVETNPAQYYRLKSECGKAPQMIRVPYYYEWTEERQSIEEKYPKFKDWVGNPLVDWITNDGYEWIE